MTFELYPWRFVFTAKDSIFFPKGKSGNVIRGAFGSIFRRLACSSDCSSAPDGPHMPDCPYARVFQPTLAAPGPSGLADQPRPFVFRAWRLDGLVVPPGGAFHFDVHVFLTKERVLPYFVGSFLELADVGLGPQRGRAKLESVWQLDRSGHRDILVASEDRILEDAAPVRLPLQPESSQDRVTICFLTPTELKSGQGIVERPDFFTVFGRARDRVATLSALYGSGPLDIDFRGLGDRSRRVELTDCRMERVEAERYSTRTRQTHSLGGFTGYAQYRGELGEFLPFLRAAEWTGIGRQTVWGKGEIRCQTP